MQKTISSGLKFAVAAAALGGVGLSLLQSTADGYSHWVKRLLYFTAQSNLWLGFTFLALAVLALRGKTPPQWLYVLKYIFTVSITVTGLVFSVLLAPFAPPEYHLGAFSSILTHAVSPVLAIVDFFLDKRRFFLTKRHALFCLFPPLYYTLSTALLTGLGLDFGRGDSFPYFFLDHRSQAGVFGFSVAPPFTGTFYWIFALALFVTGIGFLYAHLHNKGIKKSEADP